VGTAKRGVPQKRTLTGSPTAGGVLGSLLAQLLPLREEDPAFQRLTRSMKRIPSR
jgi:hypothetical protein